MLLFDDILIIIVLLIVLLLVLLSRPDDSPWEGGTFKLTLTFGEEYPNKPPSVRFVTRMFHPNGYMDKFLNIILSSSVVYVNGQICLDILQNQWSPIYDIAAILTSIQSLLTDPNPNSPANVEAAKLFQENRAEYDRKVLNFFPVNLLFFISWKKKKKSDVCVYISFFYTLESAESLLNAM